MRAFLAIDINDAVRERISVLQGVLRMAAPRLKWVDPGRIHLTLKFLGEVAESRLDIIRAVLDRVAVTTAPFELHIRKTGVFPPTGPPRVVWIGAKDANGALLRLHEELEAGLGPLGFLREDRPFRPHLTLARCKDRGAARGLWPALNEHRGFDAGMTTVEQLVLYQSTLSRRGPIYEPISKHELTIC